MRVNRSAVERRAATIGTRRTVKKEWQAAWLLRAITLMDLTTLCGDDTPGNVRRLCAKARQPVRDDLLEALGVGDLRHHGRRGLRLSRVRARPRSRRSRAAASRWRRSPPASRPGSRPFEQRIAEIRRVGGGRRARRSTSSSPARHVLTGNWQRALRRGARLPRGLRRRAHQDHPRHRRAGTLRNVARASLVCMMAGADFIKTSHRQGERQRHAAGRPGDGARDPRVPRAHRPRRRLQAGRRHPHGQGGARLAGADEGGAGRPLAASPTCSASARARCSPTSSASSSTS